MAQKRNTFIVTVAILSVAAVLLFASGPPRAESVPELGAWGADRGISVVGEGTFKVRPDQSRVVIGIEGRAEGPAGALLTAGDRTEAVLAELKSMGYGANEVSQLSFQLSQEPTGFRGQQQLEVLVTDLDKLSRFLDKVVLAGASTVNMVSFGVKNEADLRRQAVDRAIKDARVKAEAAASSGKVRLGELRNLVVEPPGPGPTGPGEASVRATVKATFAVSP